MLAGGNERVCASVSPSIRVLASTSSFGLRSFRLAVKLAPTQQNKLIVNGYTDNAPIGPALKKEGITSNEELSQKRAESVMAFLISQKVKPDLVSAHGYGDANPVAPNTTAKGRAQNRRVELTLCLACYRAWIEDPAGSHAIY